MTATLFDTPAPSHATFTLRPYQEQAKRCVLEAWNDHHATLVVLPTGCGKTILFASIIEARDSGRCLVLAHREELIFQAADKIQKVTGERCAIEMASQWADIYTKARVVVSTIQTQGAGSNGGRMSRFEPKDFHTLIVDEAHHATAVSYRKVLDYYKAGNSEIKILGVTATPDRADEEALGKVFESVAFDYEIINAINDGWLVPIKQRQVRVNSLDFSAVRTTAGDLNEGDLAQIMEQEKNLHGIAAPTIEIVGDRKTLVFATSCAQADQLMEIFNRHRTGCARFVHGKTPKDERRGMLADFAKGKFQYLVNVGVATEGFDDPGIQVVAIARPTKSRSLYAQMVGRGTRVHPDAGIEGEGLSGNDRKALIAFSAKPDCEVLDFVGNSGRHKLMTTADILGGKFSDDAIARAIRESKKKNDKGVSADMLEELERAKKEIHEERVAARQRELDKRNRIKAKATFSSSYIDPFDLFDIEPERPRGWDRGRPLTDKMREVLAKNGFHDDLPFAQACQVIDQIKQHPEKLPPTEKQRGILQRFGFDVTNLNKARASELIDSLAANGWKRP